MADLAVTDLTFTEIRVLQRVQGTRSYKSILGKISIPSSAALYRTGGVPISGITNSATGAVIAANGLACPGLGCPNEIVDLLVGGENEATSHVAAFIPGVAGTTPHKLKLFVESAAGTGPLPEVPDSTAANDATKFPGAPTEIFVKVTGY